MLLTIGVICFSYNHMIVWGTTLVIADLLTIVILITTDEARTLTMIVHYRKPSSLIGLVLYRNSLIILTRELVVESNKRSQELYSYL